MPPGPAGGGPAEGGLCAVAASADGKVLAAGGQGRTLFLLDGDDLAVRQRLWHGARIQALAFSRDGSRLTVADDADTVSLLDRAGGKVLSRAAGVRGLVVAAGADVAVVRSLSSVQGSLLRVLSLVDGSEQGKVELKERVSAYALDPAGKQLVVLGMSLEGNERRVPLSETPRELAGPARREFQQRHDGLVTFLRTYDLASGKVTREHTLWYTSDSDSTRLFLAGEVCWVTNYNNSCARVAADGTVTLFETGVLFNYALAASPDGKVLLAGGLREGTFGPPGAPADGPPENRRRRFEVPPLPGADEFVSAGVVRPDGTMVVVTTGHRLARLSREGWVEKLVPVY